MGTFPQEILQYLGLLSRILIVLFLIFTEVRILAKQFEGSQKKHVCIFHMLTIRGHLAESFCAVYGACRQLIQRPPG